VGPVTDERGIRVKVILWVTRRAMTRGSRVSGRIILNPDVIFV
jgi:hypothetical protein